MGQQEPQSIMTLYQIFTAHHSTIKFDVINAAYEVRLSIITYTMPTKKTRPKRHPYTKLKEIPTYKIHSQAPEDPPYRSKKSYKGMNYLMNSRVLMAKANFMVRSPYIA